MPYTNDPLATALFLTGLVLLVLVWAMYDGQFDDLDRAALIPWDDEKDPPPAVVEASRAWERKQEVDWSRF